MSSPPYRDHDRSIQRYSGVPYEGSRTGEATRWQRFLKLLMPWLKKKATLADALAEDVAKAEGKRRKGEAKEQDALARKAAEEAREIAARVDQQKIVNTRQVCDLADDHFADDPLTQKALKLAALNQLDPALSRDMAKFRAKLENLHQRCGTDVKIIADVAACFKRPKAHSTKTDGICAGDGIRS